MFELNKSHVTQVYMNVFVHMLTLSFTTNDIPRPTSLWVKGEKGIQKCARRAHRCSLLEPFNVEEQYTETFANTGRTLQIQVQIQMTEYSRAGWCIRTRISVAFASTRNCCVLVVPSGSGFSFILTKSKYRSSDMRIRSVSHLPLLIHVCFVIDVEQFEAN